MVVPTLLVGICIEKFMVCKGYESKDLGFRMLSKEFTAHAICQIHPFQFARVDFINLECQLSIPGPLNVILNAFLLLIFQSLRLMPLCKVKTLRWLLDIV